MLCRVVIGCSGLPYDVTPEQALEHKEVRERIQVSVNQLQIATEKFLERILASIDHIPLVTSLFLVTISVTTFQQYLLLF